MMTETPLRCRQRRIIRRIVAARFTVLLLAVSLTPAVSVGQEPLPRVLILGDSIYRQPAAEIAKQLKGKVEIVYATMKPGEVRHTSAVLNDLESLLGKEPWDLIYFNLGLGDLVYRAPKMRAFRALPIEAGGVRTTAPRDYEDNLRRLTTRLKASGAKLIWASTTPIRHSASNIFLMGSEIEYNAIAAKVMREEGVPICDMYSYVFDLIDMQRPASHGADPFFFDRKPLAPPMIRSIFQELALDEAGRVASP